MFSPLFAILLDGHNVKEYNRRELRDALGMVLQETWLFKGTIMLNNSQADKHISIYTRQASVLLPVPVSIM